MTNSARRPIQGIIIILCFFLLESCKNGEEKKDVTTGEKDVITTKDKATESQPLAAGPFTVLKLEKQGLLDLFQNSNTKKLLIQFSDDGTSQFMQGVAFGAKKDNIYQNVLKNLTPASTDSWDTTGLKILGNNELTKKQIKTLIGGNITPANAKDLYFYPIKNNNNQIYFIVSTTLVPFTTTGPKTMLTYPTGGEDSKPSPPAPPCTVCD